MLITVKRFFFAGLLCLAACSDDKPVTIEPGVFTQDWPTVLRGNLIKNKRCAIDRINGKAAKDNTLTIKSGEPLRMSGWAVSQTNGAPSAIYIQLVGPALSYTALAQKHTVRPDVNQYFGLDASLSTGFELEAAQNIEPGEYRLEILQPGDRDISRCEKKTTLRINPS